MQPVSRPKHATLRTAKGEKTHRAILETAVQLASEKGLDNLSIGRLAAELNMSKSGLFAHFGSKEGLQRATIETAGNIFIDEVIRPALKQEKGMPRLQALCENWLLYEERKVFKGGCFFAMTSSEYKSRPGPLRDLLSTRLREWLNFLTEMIKNAQSLGHIQQSVDASQLAFEIQALLMGGNWAFQLHDETRALSQARTAIWQRLRSVSTSRAHLETLETDQDR